MDFSCQVPCGAMVSGYPPILKEAGISDLVRETLVQIIYIIYIYIHTHII